MNHDATLPRRVPALAAERPVPPARPFPTRAALLGITAALGAAGWEVGRGSLYTSGSNLGYWLGVVGGTLMCVLMFYPVRKHVRLLRTWGPLKYWFRAHMICGILAPLLILFHSTFHARSLNAGVALTCMILVTVSGVVGRFIYRRIHHGLYGSRATLQELQQELQEQLAALDPLLTWLPTVRREMERFSLLAGNRPPGWRPRTAHFLTLGGKRYLTGRRIRRAIGADHPAHDGPSPPRAASPALLKTIDATVRAVQRTAQFAMYERLFSLWHVLHVPIVYMLVVSAIVHVLAVHMY